MIQLKERYKKEWRVLKCDYVKHSPSKLSTMNTAPTQKYKDVPREDSDSS